MGFIEEIERRKQQQIQQEISQEISRKATLEARAKREQQLAAEHKKRVAINAERIERDAISFIQDRLTIVGLLDQLNQFGYRGYFEDVARISGFKLGWALYTRHLSGYESSANPAVLKQQEDAHRKFKDASTKLGWTQLLDGKATRHPGHAFFNDRVTTIKEKKMTEPEEIAIGIRFLKEKVRTDEHRNRLAEFLRIEYESPTETWDHVAYVRIDSQSKATITGYDQRQVDFKNIGLLDEELEQAIHNPAVLHETHMTRWLPPSRGSSSGGGSPGNGYNEGSTAGCMSGNSEISTPNGSVPIKDLKEGDLVWTVDRFGHKVQTVIVQKTKRLVSKNHKMAHIILKDGRELIVSPGHPTIDNKEIGNLVKGQVLDKSQIVSVRIMPYREKYTYDILPSGKTGGYWANDILIGSTLSNQFKNAQLHNRLFA